MREREEGREEEGGAFNRRPKEEEEEEEKRLLRAPRAAVWAPIVAEPGLEPDKMDPDSN